MISENYTRILKLSLLISLLIGIFYISYFQKIKNNGEISRAKQTLYEVTNTDREQIKFEHISNIENTSNKYHYFKVLKTSGEEYNINYLVEKVNFNVYVRDKKGFVIPYEDYLNNNSIIGIYFNELKKINYDNIPAATKNYIETEGGINFLIKIQEISESININAIEHWGGIVKYTDLIINGVNPVSLNEGF